MLDKQAKRGVLGPTVERASDETLWEFGRDNKVKGGDMQLVRSD
jgi:hypothetical protein